MKITKAIKLIKKCVIASIVALAQSDVFAAKGFYSTEKTPDGRWYVVDADGARTIIRGIDWVRYDGHSCQVEDRRHYYEWNETHYASRAEWEEETLRRLKKWGFNMLGAGSDASLQNRGLIHATALGMGGSFGKPLDYDDERWICVSMKSPGTQLPNVFHPDFPAHCEKIAAKVCAKMKDDRNMLGWFIDNELRWWGMVRGERKATGVYDTCMQFKDGHSAKKAAIEFAKAHPDFKGDKMKEAFLGLVAERYFRITIDSIKKFDPNHMILGCRFAGLDGAPDIVWRTAGRFCDIVTFNCYPKADLDRNIMMLHDRPLVEQLAERYAIVGKPMLVTEWSFPALDSGLLCTDGAGQRFRTQYERTRATELCAKTFLSLPFFIGYDYFMWVDEPYSGISRLFPENTNYGLVSERGVPYPEITAMFAKLHSEIDKWHNAPVPKARPFKLELETAVGGGEPIKSVKLDGEEFGSIRARLDYLCENTKDHFRLTKVEKVVRKGGKTTVTVYGAKGDCAALVDFEFETSVAAGEFSMAARKVVNCGKKEFAVKSIGFLLESDSALWREAPREKAVPQLWKGACAQSRVELDGREIGMRSHSPYCRAVGFSFEGENKDPCVEAYMECPAQLNVKPGETEELSSNFNILVYAIPAPECGVEKALFKGERATYSPDGTSIAFQRLKGSDYHVGVCPANDPSRVKWIDSAARNTSFPAWSRDGSKLIYSYTEDTNTAYSAWKTNSDKGINLRIWDKRSGAVKNLTKGRHRDYSASFGPNDEFVYYTSTEFYENAPMADWRRSMAALYRIDAAGGTPKKMAEYFVSNAGIAAPEISPDGTKMVMSILPAFFDTWRIAIASPLTPNKFRPLTRRNMSAVSASWHPNSKYIAFSGYTVGDDGWSVYVMDVENEKMFKICLGRNPVFTPDGGTIVYDRDGTVYSRDIKIYSRGAK